MRAGGSPEFGGTSVTVVAEQDDVGVPEHGGWDSGPGGLADEPVVARRVETRGGDEPGAGDVDDGGRAADDRDAERWPGRRDRALS